MAAVAGQGGTETGDVRQGIFSEEHSRGERKREEGPRAAPGAFALSAGIPAARQRPDQRAASRLVVEIQAVATDAFAEQ